MRAPIATLMLASMLASCTGLHSNVAGSFQCGAARGTCEPTISIDDRALADIERTKRQAGEPTIVAPLAGDMSDLTGYPLRKAKVVFRGFVDEKGRTHEPYVVTLPLRDAWNEAPVGAAVMPATASVLLGGKSADDLREAIAGTPTSESADATPGLPVVVGRVVPAQAVQADGGHAPKSATATGTAAAILSAPQSFPASTTVHP
jgi:conjugal transfer pilus assembly protein TraV